MAVIFDSSFLLALTYSQEEKHDICVEAVQGLRETFIIPVTVLPELAYLMASRFGHYYMRQFVKQISSSGWRIENLLADDLVRVGELLTIYADAELDFADATIITIAERLGVETILTLDRRDFSIVRPKHVPYFNLLP